MSTPILAEPDTTGWLLEMSGHGDGMVAKAIKPGGDIIGIVFRSTSERLFRLWIPGRSGMGRFDTQVEAIDALTDLANMVTAVNA